MQHENRILFFQVLIQTFCGLIFSGVKDVGVYIRSDGDRAVAKDIRNRLQIVSLEDHQACRGMAQVVKADTFQSGRS